MALASMVLELRSDDGTAVNGDVMQRGRSFYCKRLMGGQEGQEGRTAAAN
jgi:hypothetical protein